MHPTIEDTNRHIRRKPLNNKILNQRIARRRNHHHHGHSLSPLPHNQTPHEIKEGKKQEELGLLLGHPNISYIADDQEGSSFISHQLDQSL